MLRGVKVSVLFSKLLARTNGNAHSQGNDSKKSFKIIGQIRRIEGERYGETLFSSLCMYRHAFKYGLQIQCCVKENGKRQRQKHRRQRRCQR